MFIIDLLELNPIRKEYGTIETLLIPIQKNLKMYLAKIQDFKNEFTLSTKLNKLEKELLLT